MEFVGLALAIPPLLGGLMRVITFVDEAQSRFQAVPTVIASLVAQCNTMHIVLGRLQYLDISRAVPCERDRTRLLQDIETIISNCRNTLLRLEAFLLEDCQDNEKRFDGCSSPQVGKRARVMFLRQEEQIQSLLSQLSSYNSSILVLIGTTNNQSIDAIHTRLDTQSAALGTLLERRTNVPIEANPSVVSLDAESLNFSSIASDELSTTAFHFDRERRRSSSATFDFDSIIADTKIYQRTRTSGTLQNLECPKSTEKSNEKTRRPQPEPTTEKPNRLIIQVEDSVNVDISESTEDRDISSSRPRPGARNLKPARLINRSPSLVFKATRNALVRTQGNYSKSSLTSDLPALELVVTGFGLDKNSLAQSLAKLRSKDVTKNPSFSNHTLCVIDGRTAFIHVVDTPLGEDHYLVQELFFKPAQCFMLVYDVSSRKSFDYAISCHKILAEKRLVSTTHAAQRAPLVLVGNNADCGDRRQVSMVEGGDLANQFCCLYIETSSKSGLNVEQAFVYMIHSVRTPSGTASRSGMS